MKNNDRRLLAKSSVSNTTELPYKFSGPELIPIRTRTNDQGKYVDTRQSIWSWSDGGCSISHDWRKCQLSPEVNELAKGFLAFVLEKLSPRTAKMYSGMLYQLSKMSLGKSFPWSAGAMLAETAEWKEPRSVSFFRQFYRWALNRGISGFSQSGYLALKEIKVAHYPAYSRIFLSQTGLSIEQEADVIARIDDASMGFDSWCRLQANILLQLGFELGPRAIQLHSLDISDFELVIDNTSNRYYTLWLPMAKKIGQRRPERRPRKVSQSLGDKLKRHIDYLQSHFDCEALFVDETGKRLAVPVVIDLIRGELNSAGISRPGQVTMLLRHHLGQGLADQGAPLATIAELLGHNSTVAAHAYVAATPNIAQIKAKALGKSPIYQKLMRAMLTGEIQSRRLNHQDRHVRGIVGMQYIGDIGACALPSHTACPYNPVYACYTCKKFHPFADGRHAQVKRALEKEAQRFIDAAEADGGSVEHNRAVTQHELTILAVQATIARCEEHLSGEEKTDE